VSEFVEFLTGLFQLVLKVFDGRTIYKVDDAMAGFDPRLFVAGDGFITPDARSFGGPMVTSNIIEGVPGAVGWPLDGVVRMVVWINVAIDEVQARKAGGVVI